jgi:hypothetical protein
MILERLVKGFMVVEDLKDETIISFREARCKGCPYNKSGICNQCFCLIKVKVKSYTNRTMKNGLPNGPIEKSHCPIGNWLDKDVTNFYRAKRNKILIK